MLQMYFFGSGHASYNDLPLSGFPRHQAYQILCFLLLKPRRPQLRETLSNLFWGDHPSQIARKYLRNSLWRLKQSLEAVHANPEDFLLIAEDCVSFIFTSQYWLDVEVFENTIRSCQQISPKDLSPEQIESLEQAVKLYTGDLLEGNFDEWCLAERERLSILYIKALASLMSYYEYHNNIQQALNCGQIILSRDNTRESVHVQMMRLYDRLGDRDAAMQQYHRCAQILRTELGIDPMRETTTAYQQIVQNAEADLTMSKRQAPLVDQLDDLTIASNTQSLIEYATAKINKLHQVLDETSAEIHRLEQILQQTQVQSKHS